MAWWYSITYCMASGWMVLFAADSTSEASSFSPWISLIGSLGSAGAALLVAYKALEYIRGRDSDNKELVSRVESIADKFEKRVDSVVDKLDGTVREIHKDHQQTSQFLFTLQRETVSTMESFKTRLEQLAEKIDKRSGQ